MCISDFMIFLAILETNITRKLPILQNSCSKDSLMSVGDLFEILGE